MLSAVSAIASAWFGVLSVYFGLAKHLPAYKPVFAKSFLKKPVIMTSISIVFVGFYVGYISDPVTIKLFEFINFPFTGVADFNVQSVSLILTFFVGIPIGLSYRWINNLVDHIEQDKDNEKYFRYASISMAIVSAVFATASAILAIK
ncbi:hypothetical protein [Aeromonas sp. JL9]|uniref:hypothetical protein n=1 Tax=Aeromonas sp. JL9 TaxID=2950549 RepID=UPI00210B67B5|nr:hypothetical protein [Aeromonas sp. JL9]MCQ4107604.1 hypothetical protein [Aeromonas sp. JL9]